MDTKSIELLNKLHPSIRQDAIDAYNEAVRRTPVGVHPSITSTLRPFSESQKLYNQGRITPGQIVSNAKPGQSYHNYGMAIDFCLIINGKAVWDEKNPNWKVVVDCFKKRGFSWGGDWKFKDYPHFEKTHGFHWKQLLALHNKKQFIPGETYINLT